jgi:Bacterial SH3 domain
MRAMSPRRKLVIIVSAEALALLALVAFFAGVLLRAPGPAAVPGLVTAASPPSPGPSSTAAALNTRAPGAPATATWTPFAPVTTAPPATATIAASATLTPGVTGQVTATGGGLRLRQSPGTAGAIIDSLSALDQLKIVGRTVDNAWLQVITAKGTQGWVKAVWVTVTGNLTTLAVTGQAADVPDVALAYLSGITAHARQIFVAGQALGNQADVFSKVGDSNTDNPAFLTPFDQGNYSLGTYADLAPTISYFKGSFSRISSAAVGGFSTAKVLDPANDRGPCNAGETPLACEYRVNKPSVALILLGTGDQHSWQGFEARYRTVIEYTIKQGIVPVLMTKADDLESKEDTAPVGFTNDTIRRLALEYDIPLLDLRQAVEPLPNLGCGPDGFHYNSPPDGQTTTFDSAHLTYGFNMRNLTALQALDALRRYVLY